MIPNVTELQPLILNLLNLKEEDVFMDFGKEYPECLCMVVVSDVGPGKMNQVMKLLKEKGEGELRLCANIVDEKFFYRFAGLDFESAWEESWNCAETTVRMG